MVPREETRRESNLNWNCGYDLNADQIKLILLSSFAWLRGGRDKSSWPPMFAVEMWVLTVFRPCLGRRRGSSSGACAQTQKASCFSQATADFYDLLIECPASPTVWKSFLVVAINDRHRYGTLIGIKTEW